MYTCAKCTVFRDGIFFSRGTTRIEKPSGCSQDFSSFSHVTYATDIPTISLSSRLHPLLIRPLRYTSSRVFP